MDWKNELPRMGQTAKRAARLLARAETAEKNAALMEMAAALREFSEKIIEGNRLDLENGRENGLPGSLMDRLTLDAGRVEAMARGVEEVAALPDPTGEMPRSWRNADGLQISQVRVPLGVAGVIYEARPNVTSDAAALCLKSGNAAILRGGREALYSNRAIAGALTAALAKTTLPEGCVQLLDTSDREASVALMGLRDLDVLIPRGGAGLKKSVSENARVPYIMTGMGNCHIFIDAGADAEKARRIAVNAKCQRPGVCNAMETLLVHRDAAPGLLPGLLAELDALGVEIRGDESVRALYPGALAATEADWDTEYLDLTLAVKTVADIDEAISHIAEYSTGHSEAIVTESWTNARKFQKQVDSAAVYVNASTRFTDGSVFGFGAEIGISTQKMHVRGPMGLEHLTSFKYIISGDGQIRK